MKKIYNTLATLLIGIAVVACSSPKVIPDKELANIFRDAILVNAYLQHNQQHKQDSINIYEPIFARYGYTTEDVHHTINNFSRRKSASLGTVTNYMTNLLQEQTDRLNLLVTKQDTIDQVARRRSTEVIYQDTSIVATTAADTALLKIVIRHAKTGRYTIKGFYTLEDDSKSDKDKRAITGKKKSTVKPVSRRCRISWMCGDSTIRTISNILLVKGRRSHINLNFDLGKNDSLADRIVINFHHTNQKSNRPRKTPITIHELKVEYKAYDEDALLALFNEQSQMRIFADTMLRLKIKSLPAEAVDSLGRRWTYRLFDEGVDSLNSEGVVPYVWSRFNPSLIADITSEQ